MLKNNYFVASLQEVVSSQSGGPKKCTNCDRSPAKFHCLDCHLYFCGGCRDAHNWLKITRSHRVMSLVELQSGKYQGELVRRQLVFCDIHNHCEVDSVCVSCDKAICEECTYSLHRDHRLGSLHHTALRDRHLLHSLNTAVKNQHNMFNGSLQKLDSYEQQCRSEKKILLEHLQRQKEKLQALLDSCHLELTKHVESVYEEEKKHQDGKRQQIKATMDTMSHQCNLAEKLLQHGKDADIMTMGKLLKINLNNYSFSVPSELDSKLVVQYTPSSIHKARMLPLFGRIIKKRNVAVKPNTHMSISLEESMHRGKYTPNLLRSFRAKTSQDTKGCKPTGVAVSADNHIILVDDINKKIKVFDQQGELTAEICPEGVHALIDPWDVAITEEGNYAITDRGARTVKIYSPNGNYVSAFGSHLKCPWGVASNSKGELIVTDPASKAVFVHDKHGNVLFELDCHNQNNLFMCPEYVTVNKNNDIIVSDFDKHCITVFDSQGRFLYRYGCRGKGIHEFNVPCGVCTNSEGNILVVDYNNQRIHMLSEDGQFLCFLATKEDGIMTPQAVAVNSQGHLVVVDGTNIKTFMLANESERRESDDLNLVNLMYDGVVFEDDDESGSTETDI